MIHPLLIRTSKAESVSGRTNPKGFSKDFQYLSYLQPKDYSVSTPVDDDLLLSKGWEEKVVEIFREMKPLLDFVNYTVDDYE